MSTTTRYRNKRRLIDSQDEIIQRALRSKRPRTHHTDLLIRIPLPRLPEQEVVAKLFTTTQNGQKEAAVVSIGRPVIIGRNSLQCTYVILDPVVSNVHFKVYAIKASSGAILLTCQDLSTNGVKLNDHLIKKSSFILMHGDIIKIPRSQTFKCVYSALAMDAQKRTLLDPTPPVVPTDKALGKYKVTSCTLGSGTYATVNLAYIISNSANGSIYKQVACKMLKLDTDAERAKLMREVELLKGLNHPNINHILDVIVKDRFLNIFLDLSTGGDLFTYISTRRSGRIKEVEAKYCAFQLMLGLQYLHARNVSHRDLKPENILLHEPGPFPRLVIADFGLARPRAHEQTLNVVGTICYMPPEAIMALTVKGMGYVGIYADAWSLGLILFAMLCGYNPFDWDSDDRTIRQTNLRSSLVVSNNDRSEALVMSRIVSSPVDFQDSMWDECPAARDLVKQLLIHKPKHRETVKGALLSRWIQSDLENLKEGYRNKIGCDTVALELLE